MEKKLILTLKMNKKMNKVMNKRIKQKMKMMNVEDTQSDKDDNIELRLLLKKM